MSRASVPHNDFIRGKRTLQRVVAGYLINWCLSGYAPNNISLLLFIYVYYLYRIFIAVLLRCYSFY